MENSKSEEKKAKILLFGLDNSGKSSILLSLQYDANLLDFTQLKPTFGVNVRDIRGKDCIIYAWDFGGQEKYRVEYLNNINKYISEIDKIIYVIDVQDINRYDASLDYLTQIIEKLQEYKYKGTIDIFLHKYDPNIRLKKEFSKIDNIVEEKLVKNIKNLKNEDINIDIFKTTIYTIFEKKLVNI
ncbi:MAG: ADP-ribosylation factor-like protein [Promethearchaeota archaeon]